MLRTHLLPALRAGASSLHQRFLYGSATATRPARFVAEDYLIASCGLTLAQARRASKHLAHLKSPDNPDAVRAFLAGIGVSQAHATAAIARHPLLLASKVDKTLTPRAAQLQQMGLSASEISRLVSIIPSIFVRPTEISRLPFYLSFLGSYENVLIALARARYLLNANIDNVVKPNIEFLLQCGLTPCDVASVCLRVGLLFTMAPERVNEVVARADKLGVPRSSRMYRKALEVAKDHDTGAIGAKVDFLKKALGCSESEVGIAVCKMPALLSTSVGKLGRMVEFLKLDVGLEACYIISRPQLFNHSLEKRLIPRHYVIKVLKAKGILKKDVDFHNVACASHKRFAERFLDPHKKSIPWLAETYAAACAGDSGVFVSVVKLYWLGWNVTLITHRIFHQLICDQTCSVRGCYLRWNLDTRWVLSMIWYLLGCTRSSSSDSSFLNLNPISLWSSSNATVPSARDSCFTFSPHPLPPQPIPRPAAQIYRIAIRRAHTIIRFLSTSSHHRPHVSGHATPSRPTAVRSGGHPIPSVRSPPQTHPLSSSSPPPDLRVPNQSEAALSPSPLRPHAPRRDGRAPPRLLHPPPRRRRGLRLHRRDPRRAPVRLLRPRGAGAPLSPPGPAPPPRGPRQAPRRRGRGGELRVRAVGGGRRERHPRADGLRPREAGEDLRRRGRRRVLRQPHRPARGEDPAHRRDRQVVRAAAARRQLPQRRRRQLPRVDRAADRRRVRERLQLAHGHRGRHRHLRRAARVAGPRADRAARPEDDRRQERPPQDTARPGAHRRLHRTVRPRRIQLNRHERPEADRGDRIRVRVARRPARSLTGLRRPSSPLKLSCYCLKQWHESSRNVGPVPFRPAD